jgi:SAM-dependent methyltransferase
MMQHEIDWTPEQVRRFWDYMGATPGFEDLYFAKRSGRALIRHVARKIRIGTAVDMGCGRGDLLHLLLDRGYDAYGADQSQASVDAVNARFQGNPHFHGAVVGTALPDGIADTVFMLEVVEHMDDGALTQALGDARRILRSGGHLVLTTPNDENLQAAKRMCPECGAVFHQMQHVRSWTAQTLSQFLERIGFVCRSADATVLSSHSGLMGIAHKLRYTGRKRPNLVYIGVKS